MLIKIIIVTLIVIVVTVTKEVVKITVQNFKEFSNFSDLLFINKTD